MLDIKFIKENPKLVKENIKKKFQDEKICLVDESIDLYDMSCKLKAEGDELRSRRNKMSSLIGELYREGKKEEAEKNKKLVQEINDQLIDIEKREENCNKELNERLMVIPNIIDDSVPIGEDDSKNVENKRFRKSLFQQRLFQNRCGGY